MKRLQLLLTFLLCCSLLHAQRKENIVNLGIKSGFSSTIYDVQELAIAGTPIQEHMAKSEISSFHTAFARFNIHRHYLQTELSYNISNYTIDFNTDQWLSSSLPSEKSSISTKIIGIEVPIYYGYHIIKEGPYGMSIYIGPKVKFVLTDYSRHFFENFPYYQIEESIYPINFSLMAGFGVNILPIFFDFSFEYGLHNMSNGFIVTDSEGYSDTHEFVFNRRKNVLSFSIGFIF